MHCLPPTDDLVQSALVLDEIKNWLNVWYSTHLNPMLEITDQYYRKVGGGHNPRYIYSKLISDFITVAKRYGELSAMRSWTNQPAGTKAMYEQFVHITTTWQTFALICVDFDGKQNAMTTYKFDPESFVKLFNDVNANGESVLPADLGKKASDWLGKRTKIEEQALIIIPQKMAKLFKTEFKKFIEKLLANDGQYAPYVNKDFKKTLKEGMGTLEPRPTPDKMKKKGK